MPVQEKKVHVSLLVEKRAKFAKQLVPIKPKTVCRFILMLEYQ